MLYRIRECAMHWAHEAVLLLWQCNEAKSKNEKCFNMIQMNVKLYRYPAWACRLWFSEMCRCFDVSIEIYRKPQSNNDRMYIIQCTFSHFCCDWKMPKCGEGEREREGEQSMSVIRFYITWSFWRVCSIIKTFYAITQSMFDVLSSYSSYPQWYQQQAHEWKCYNM